MLLPLDRLARMVGKRSHVSVDVIHLNIGRALTDSIVDLGCKFGLLNLRGRGDAQKRTFENQTLKHSAQLQVPIASLHDILVQ